MIAVSPGCRCAGVGPAEVGPDASAATPGLSASASAAPPALPDEDPPEQEGASDPSGAASTRFPDAGPKVDRDLEGPADSGLIVSGA